MAAPIPCPFCDATAAAAGDSAACGACGRSLVVLGRYRLAALLARGDGVLRYAACDVLNAAAPAVDAWVARQRALLDEEGAFAAGPEDGGVFVVVRATPWSVAARGGASVAGGAAARAGGVPMTLKLIGLAALLAAGIGIGLAIRRSPDAPPAPAGAATAPPAAPGDPLATAAAAPTPEPPAPEPVPVPVQPAAPAPTAVADPLSDAASPDWSRGACDSIEDCYTQAKAWGPVNGTETVHFDGKGKPTFVSFTGSVPYAVQACLRTAGMTERLDGYAGPPATVTCTFSGNIVRGTAEMMFDSDFQAAKR
jgi:hypothetical protein